MANKFSPKVVARGKRIRQIRKERIKNEFKALKEVKKNNSKTQIFNILFILAVLVGLIIYIINVEGIEKINYILETADYKWMAIGVLCVVAEWTFEALAMHIPLKKIYSKHKYLLSLKTNIIGKFFNNITPFSSGGQPFQAYILSKHGLRASDTFSVLMMKFVVYQLGLFSWALILLGINFEFFNETFNSYMWLVILGFSLNLIAILAVVSAGVNKNIILKIVNPIIKLVAKIRIGRHFIIKDLNEVLQKADDSISNYSKQFDEMKKQKLNLIKMYAVSMLQLLAYLSIPFMIYKAFGNIGTTYIQILTVQVYLLLIMSFIPTPGSGLGAEGGFALFYNTIFINGLGLSILFWRIYTFYIPIIIGALVLLSMNRHEANSEIKKELQE